MKSGQMEEGLFEHVALHALPHTYFSEIHSMATLFDLENQEMKFVKPFITVRM
jgi:hypothetical protein